MVEHVLLPTRQISRTVPLLYVCLLAILTMLGTDIYLPALGEIRSDLSTSVVLVGLSLTVYSGGMLVTQLVYGPVSDVLGRKPVLLFGLAVFVASTIGCMSAHDVRVFLAFRFLQAFGVCASAVLWQPIVTDVYSRDEKKVRGAFGFVMSFVGISPALAPLIGGGIAGMLGWRYTFVPLLALGAGLLVWTAIRFDETLTRDDTRVQRLTFGALFRPYAVLLRDGKFYLYALSVAAAVGGYMAYLTVAPFALAQLGLPPVLIGLSFLPLAGLFGLGGAAAKLLVDKFDEDTALRIGTAIGLAGSLLFWLSIESGFATSAIGYAAPFGLVTFGIGITIPVGSAAVIARFATISGACSSATNCMSSLAVLVSTIAASVLYQSSGNRPLGAILCAAALLSLVCALILGSKAVPAGQTVR
jgi:DHA1 family bicyclomycin/chloramphenicol resistance-like MFS transporter